MFESYRYCWTLAIFLWPWTGQAVAQKQIEEMEQTWIGYFNQSRITNRSGVWIDLHYRLTDHYIREKTIIIARTAYIFYIGEKVRFMGGYAYANRYGRGGVDRVPEHRPWQQVQWIERKRNFTMTHAFRLEQRFRRAVENNALAEGYDFNWRLRYNLSFAVPLSRKEGGVGIPFVQLSNEIMVNAGEAIVYNYFDQDRLYAGIGYQFTPELSAHLGHLFVFQHQGAAGMYQHIHGIRLTVSHNMDLRRKVEN
jgi:hypothetical protein